MISTEQNDTQRVVSLDNMKTDAKKKKGVGLSLWIYLENLGRAWPGGGPVACLPLGLLGAGGWGWIQS